MFQWMLCIVLYVASAYRNGQLKLQVFIRIQDEKKGKFKWFYPGHHYSLCHIETLPMWQQDIWLDVLWPVLMMVQIFQEMSLCQSCYFHLQSKKLNGFELLTPWRWMQQVPKMKVIIFWLTWSHTLAGLNLVISIY